MAAVISVNVSACVPSIFTLSMNISVDVDKDHRGKRCSWRGENLCLTRVRSPGSRRPWESNNAPAHFFLVGVAAGQGTQTCSCVSPLLNNPIPDKGCMNERSFNRMNWLRCFYVCFMDWLCLQIFCFCLPMGNSVRWLCFLAGWNVRFGLFASTALS